MSISIEEAGNGIRDLIDDISILRRVYAPNELPVTPNAFPCALIIPGQIDYQEVFSGGLTVPMRILVLVVAIDSKAALDNILPLMERSGDSSLYAKLASDLTLGGKAETSKFTRCSAIGEIGWGAGSYMGFEFSGDVYV